MVYRMTEILNCGLILAFATWHAKALTTNATSEDLVKDGGLDPLLKFFPVLKVAVANGVFRSVGSAKLSPRNAAPSTGDTGNYTQAKPPATPLPSLDIFPAESFKFPFLHNKSDSQNISSKAEDMDDTLTWLKFATADEHIQGNDSVSTQNGEFAQQPIEGADKASVLNSTTSHAKSNSGLPTLAQRGGADGDVQHSDVLLATRAENATVDRDGCKLIRELKAQYTLYNHRNIFDMFSENSDDIHKQFMKCVKSSRRKFVKPKANGTVDEAIKNISLKELENLDLRNPPVFRMSVNQSAKPTESDELALSNVSSFRNEKLAVGKNFTLIQNSKAPVVPRGKRVLCFGDSLTYGYAQGDEGKHPYSIRLTKLLNNDSAASFEVITRGYVGHCVFHQLGEKLRNVIAELIPLDLIIIWGGTNDLLDYDCEHGVDLFMEILRMHEAAHEMGIKTVAVTIPEAIYRNAKQITSKEQYLERWKNTNQKIRLYQQLHADMTILCDLAKKIRKLSLTDEENKLLWDDGTHPTATGYDIIGEILYRDIVGKF